jgi:predicted phosphodiesterase
MQFSFDLISDLHVETWDQFDWTGQATSAYCIVVGDVARNRERLLETLKHLSQCYPGGVFYIDGNEEHKDYLDDLGASYHALDKDLDTIDNLVYMQNNAIIINGVAILATNAWWTYDFDPSIDVDTSLQAIQDHHGIDASSATNIVGVAYTDANYMINSVEKLQTHPEVRAIVLVTHTVPADWIISHDPDLVGNWRYNGMGNSNISAALQKDTENKIRAWCFGHYHRPVDRQSAGVRYVSNPRGRGNTEWSQPAFYPKRITIDY